MKINLTILGKYPPIQGGESSKVYWLATHLGKKGHKITVVSNCQEVEKEYKEVLKQEDLDYLQPENVELFSTHPYYNSNFIPLYNPYSEKLTSLALEAIEKNGADLILSWYLLPYAVSAFNVSNITRKKYIIQHAGSDMNRLLVNPYLFKFLKHIITQADYIMSYPRSRKTFEELRNDNNIFTHNTVIPNNFNPTVKELELSVYNPDIDSEKTILFLGKLSRQKGLDHLIDAFHMLDKKYNLLLVGGGRQQNYFNEKISKHSLDNINIIPPQPPWKIPPIIRSVKAVVIPEHNFGVPQHTSRIPLETLLCGKAPIVSKSIVHKYKGFSKYFHTFDPENTNKFSETLEEALTTEIKENEILADYNIIRTKLGVFEEYIETIENFLISRIENAKD